MRKFGCSKPFSSIIVNWRLSALRRRANTRNVSFWTLYLWPIYSINSVDKTKLTCFTPNDAAPLFLQKLTPLTHLILTRPISAAKNADQGCYDKLNTEAIGYGTCDPNTKKRCASRYMTFFLVSVVPFLRKLINLSSVLYKLQEERSINSQKKMTQLFVLNI